MSDHWKSLADLLGSPSLTPSQKPSEPDVEKAQPEHIKESIRQPEPPAAAMAAAEPAAPVEPAKPKKRSSWEALANLFNIGTAPVPTPEPIAPPPPTAIAPPPRPVSEPTTKQSELSLFKPSTPSQQNPALVDMFGEASSKPHESWGKPRRVVDDLGWDEEEPVAKKAESRSADNPVKPVRSLDETAEVEDLESVDGEPVRRSRRRRRRGGRSSRGDEALQSDTRPEETTAEFRESGSWGNVVSDDVVEIDEVVDIDEDDIPTVVDGDEEGSPIGERRPRRRRRRRGRGRGPESAEDRLPVDAEDADDDDVESVNRVLLNTDDEDGPVEDLFEGPADAESSAEPATDPRRRRRRKRNRGGKRLDEPGQDREIEIDEAEDVSDSPDADLGDDEEGGHRHRNIPTWEDSLAVLIEANIENHRRNEGRGGGPRGGGRNRGGRR
jgi:hypothetical protein